MKMTIFEKNQNFSLPVLRSAKRAIIWLVFGVLGKFRYFLFLLSCQGPARSAARLLIRSLNWQPVHLGSLSAITTESVTLAADSSSTIVAPSFYGKRSSTRTDVYPPLQAHVMHGDGASIVATAYSPGIICRKSLFLPTHLSHEKDRVKTDNGGIFRLESSFAVGKIKSTLEMQEGILIGGAGAFNWYHFVVEILPKLFLAKKLPSRYKDFPLLVSDECQSNPSFSTALSLYAENRELYFIPRGHSVGLNRAIIFDEISIGPFNLAAGEWPQASDYSQHDEVMREFFVDFRERLLGQASAGKKSANLNRRLFLTRPGIRRNYNQDELYGIATRYGFEKFSPEEFSLHEQVAIFSQAEFLVGPSGAAWVGMIFNASGLKGLSWLPRVYEKFASYSTMANLLGHELHFIENKTVRQLKTHEVYTASYTICPVEFETALKRLIEGNNEHPLS